MENIKDAFVYYEIAVKQPDVNFFTGLRIYVPENELFIKFYCTCDPQNRHSVGFYLDDGMHYFCLCHGHNETNDLFFQLRSQHKITNLTCTREPPEKYYIITLKDKDGFSPPSLLHLGKSAIFQFNLEKECNNPKIFPTGLLNTPIRTKNCIIMRCPSEFPLSDCSESCPFQNRKCNTRLYKEDPYIQEREWSEYWNNKNSQIKNLIF